MSLVDELCAIEKEATRGVADAQCLEDLDRIRVAVTGKKGSLTKILRSMGDIPQEERPAFGRRVNEVSAHVESVLDKRRSELEQQIMEERFAADAVDVTLPGRKRPLGTQHPVSRVIEEMEDIFCGMGYVVMDGSYIETTYYNFTALNVAPGHPSRLPSDTFYVVDNAEDGKGLEESEKSCALQDSRLLLRTQTSGVQVHVMEKHHLPIYMICPGTVFRPDTPDACHLPQFNQVEGLVVDEGITFGDLKGTLDHFCKEIFGADRSVRYRPHFFPFTEPSCEVDVSCNVCNGAGCRFCKNTGWLEILGCGMVHPNVLDMSGIDSSRYSGFAFGIGVERVVALRYGLPDCRMLLTGDRRFLDQF